MQCRALVLPSHRKQHTPQLWMEGTGEGCWFFCSPKLLYLSTMSQQFCRRLSESQKWPYVLPKINWIHFFMLGCKTPVGFLFVVWLHHIYFRTIRIRQFRYFQCVTFRVTLNRALMSCNVARRTRFLILSFIETHRNKEQSEKDRKLNRFLCIKVVIMTKIAL